MACNAARQVSGAYKTLQSQIDKKESEWQLIDFGPTSATFSFERDFRLSKDTLSITTLAGRKKYKLLNYQYAQRYLDGSWKYLASKLCLHKDGAYYFHLACEKDIIDKNVVDASTFMGVDVGINCLAVASTTDNECKFFAGGEIKNHRNIRSKERRRLQKAGGRYLGTRSSMRTLRKIAGRETRFMTAMNHSVSKKLVQFALQNGVSAIGMEDLTGIRKRTESKVSKEFRYEHSSWAFRQLQGFVEYKAKEVGIAVIYVNPEYTSQACPRCNHIGRNNRHGLAFRCEKCGYETHADRVGAMNIEHRTRDLRYILESQGGLVSPPDATRLFT
ncbi:MAG: transposase [Methanothrix sp.]|jgi:IS605 OrfB family transposase|nr:transposase [Methanothrix sp.]